ncbi:hypothetical protein PGRAT_06270 [Paenibacillus graminis]|uniref:Uncharacterized protein n=1 Tax=Paenibacillus graminis TaxID=189425 RepID=A0A089M4I2_9BACL|nr:hypothetical protein PGRAT_06270 [Paenibacillus graminis]
MLSIIMLIIGSMTFFLHGMFWKLMQHAKCTRKGNHNFLNKNKTAAPSFTGQRSRFGFQFSVP